MDNQIKNFYDAIPNLNKIFIKSWNRLRLIRIIVDLIIPWAIFSILEWGFKINIYYITITYLFFSHYFALLGMYNYFTILHRWDEKYRNVILPLYKNNKKDMLVKYMSDSGFLFKDNINWQKLNFKDMMSVVYKLKNSRNKYWWISLLPLCEVPFNEFYYTRLFCFRRLFIKRKFSKEYNIEVTIWDGFFASIFEGEARNQVANL